MTNWLEDLIKNKNRAVTAKEAESAARLAQQEKEIRETELRRQAICKKISDSLRNTKIETHILELVHQVIEGHPSYPDAELARSATCEGGSGILWQARYHMSSMSEKAVPLPENLEFVWNHSKEPGIMWKLVLSEHQKHDGDSYEITYTGIQVAIASQISVNGKRVNENEQAVQQALLQAFKRPTAWVVTESHYSGSGR